MRSPKAHHDVISLNSFKTTTRKHTYHYNQGYLFMCHVLFDRYMMCIYIFQYIYIHILIHIFINIKKLNTMYLIIKKKVYVICINVYVLRPKCHLGRWFLHTVLKYRRQQVWQCFPNRPVDFLRWKLHQIFIGHKEPVGQKRSKAVESYLEEYPPGNGYISHLGKRKIIFKSTFSRGYVSSLEGIPGLVSA